MSIEFRCENCGKLLSVADPANGWAKCPHCGKKVSVPTAVAALPRPHVAPNAAPAAAADLAHNRETAPAHAHAPIEAQAQAPTQEGEVMAIMARVMPWIISIFAHFGLAMILAFATMIGQAAMAGAGDENEDILVPDAAWDDQPGGTLNPSNAIPMEGAYSSSVTRSEYARSDAVADAGLTAKHAAISVAGGIGASVGSGSGKGDLLGLHGGGGGGPRSTMFGKGGNAHHVVYVIDRSGSMIDTFDMVRREMLNSISHLSPLQDFHVIFFASGNPIENPPKQLVQANKDYTQKAAEFLQDIRPEGQTNPVPALVRAFEVLANADARKKGKLLYLLTDGAFPDNQKVIDTINTWNKPVNGKKEVHIITFLYGSKAKDAVPVMQKIAEENGGNFKQVTDEDKDASMRNPSVIIASVLLAAISLIDAQTRAPAAPAAAGSMASQLTAAQGMIDKGDADRALKDIQAALTRYNSTDLPTALYLMGRARLALAANADAAAKTKLLLQAALDFMKVSTFFPYANEAPVAALEAGKALALAGDKESAKAALEMVISRFLESDAAPLARKELAKLK